MVDRLGKAHVLITEYQKIYAAKFGDKPIMNRNKLKYLLGDVLLDLSYEQVKILLAFYVKTDSDPSLTTFCYEYAEIFKAMRDNEKDADERSRLLKETEQRVREFRERYKK